MSFLSTNQQHQSTELCSVKNCFKIQKKYSRVNCRAFSFANPCIDAWNSLDNDILCASSVQAYKRRLSLVNFSKFLYVL